jgi:hypothetical protein
MWRPFAIFLALLFSAHQVRASESYPDVIRATVPTRQALPCTLCHALADGGDGAVATEFARHMLEVGMKGADPASLQRALRRNAARGWDSDGDGVPDIEELLYGTDPSSPALSSGPALMHGCSVGYLASRSHLSTVLFALIAWILWRRRCENEKRSKVSQSAGV